MSEKKNKEIRFKILSAEHLLEEKSVPPRIAELSTKEKITPEISKIEKPPELKIQEEKKIKNALEIQVPSKTPEKEVPSTLQIFPKEFKIDKNISPELQKESDQQKIFYKTEELKKPRIIPSEKTTKEVYATKKEASSDKRGLPILKYGLVATAILTVTIVSALILKKTSLQKIAFKKPVSQTSTIVALPRIETRPFSEEKQSTSVSIIIPTPTITQPVITGETSTTPTPKTEEKEPQTTTLETKEITVGETLIYPSKEIYFENIPQQEIKLNKLSIEELQEKLDLFLRKQETAETFIYLKPTFNNSLVPFNFILDYFIKPTKFSQKEINAFKKNFTGNYAFMIYYSYTRKNPVLIFEIKDPLLVRNFNQNWEKTNMSNDLKTLFLGADPGKPLGQFISKQIKSEFIYRVVNFNNNYKIAWAVFQNYLIYSSNEVGLKTAISFLK